MTLVLTFGPKAAIVRFHELRFGQLRLGLGRKAALYRLTVSGSIDGVEAHQDNRSTNAPSLRVHPSSCRDYRPLELRCYHREPKRARSRLGAKVRSR